MFHANLYLDCRYYEGEGDCPDGKNREFWDYEREWVAKTLANAPELNDCYVVYCNRNLELFEEDDGTPLSLKAFLFCCYHRSTVGRFFSISGFKSWYRSEYQGGSKTLRERQWDAHAPRLMGHCLYFRGERVNPFPLTDERRVLWHTERYWVSLISESQYNHLLLTKMLREKRVNPANGKREVPAMMQWLSRFCDEHGHPRSLICLLFTLIVSAKYDVVSPESFLAWYNDTYLKDPPQDPPQPSL